MRHGRQSLLLVLPVLALSLGAGACARQHLVVEVSGSVMYEKPRILKVSHLLRDARETGGAVSVQVTLVGDPGLRASFDITPEVADRRPMREAEPGTYRAEMSLPPTLFGGPFTVTGRLEHPDAGEVTQVDPEPINISLVEPSRPESGQIP
jgi:hypothetical protein